MEDSFRVCRGPLTYLAELPGTKCGYVCMSLFVDVEFSFDLGGREGGRAALYVALFMNIGLFCRSLFVYIQVSFDVFGGVAREGVRLRTEVSFHEYISLL